MHGDLVVQFGFGTRWISNNRRNKSFLKINLFILRIKFTYIKKNLMFFSPDLWKLFNTIMLIFFYLSKNNFTYMIYYVICRSNRVISDLPDSDWEQNLVWKFLLMWLQC
jgi:hypothetical protein